MDTQSVFFLGGSIHGFIRPHLSAHFYLFCSSNCASEFYFYFFEVVFGEIFKRNI